MIKRKVRVAVAILLLLSILLPVFPTADVSASTIEFPEISAARAVLMEAETGKILYGKNEQEPAAMASTTKIMTALLTLEATAQSDDVVEITQEMAGVEGSSLGLQAGWKITLSNLAAGMLTVSGNDAAFSAAVYLAGSEAAFAERMNERAAEIGMTDTCFVTASGLDEGDHHSTALDMARLAAVALENPAFLEIASQTSYPVSFVEPEKTVQLTNHNKLLSQVEGCIGVKTGYTEKAGRCLVSAVERDGVRLICVTLDAPNDWDDHAALYEAAFSSVQKVLLEDTQWPCTLPVVGGEQQTVELNWDIPPQVTVLGDEKISYKIFGPAFVYAPVEEGQVVAWVKWYVDDREMGTLPIQAAQTVGIQAKEKTGLQKWLWLFGF